MKIMSSLESCIHRFSHLNRATGRKGLWTESINNRAPHKPILPLAVFDLVAKGAITSSFIDVACVILG